MNEQFLKWLETQVYYPTDRIYRYNWEEVLYNAGNTNFTVRWINILR